MRIGRGRRDRHVLLVARAQHQAGRGASASEAVAPEAPRFSFRGSLEISTHAVSSPRHNQPYTRPFRLNKYFTHTLYAIML